MRLLPSPTVFLDFAKGMIVVIDAKDDRKAQNGRIQLSLSIKVKIITEIKRIVAF